MRPITHNLHTQFTVTIYTHNWAHNLQLLFTSDEEAAASKRMVFYVFSPQKRIFTKFFYLTNFAQHSFPLVIFCGSACTCSIKSLTTIEPARCLSTAIATITLAILICEGFELENGGSRQEGPVSGNT